MFGANLSQIYVDREWRAPRAKEGEMALINPATEEVWGHLTLGGAGDVDDAVSAAMAALPRWKNSPIEERIALLTAIRNIYETKVEMLAQAITHEMGSPITLSRRWQASLPLAHIDSVVATLKQFAFERRERNMTLIWEAIGVVGLITPWNWPLHQIAAKVFPALAAGCTIVLKPSEHAALSAQLFTQVLHQAGVPAGVFNLIHGKGSSVGSRISSHPDVAMVSFTGSTGAGAQVAVDAAPTIKRVTQELGGKAPAIVLHGADLDVAMQQIAGHAFANSGQSCTAAARLLVQADMADAAVNRLAKIAKAQVIGPPTDERTQVGPLVTASQFARVNGMVAQAIADGARLICGGEGRPLGVSRGYFVAPTLLSEVTSNMPIAREEVFGPVLVVIPYSDEKQLIEIANGTSYGLAAYVLGPHQESVRIARRLESGCVLINNAEPSLEMPFGGCKRSGNGKEMGIFGFMEFLELKALVE